EKMRKLSLGASLAPRMGFPALSMMPPTPAPRRSSRFCRSWSMDNPCPQYHESRSAIPLPFDRLEAVSVSFHVATAPPLRHGREHGGLVTPHALGQPAQFRGRGGLSFDQPIAQRHLRALSDQRGELVRQIQRPGHVITPGADRWASRLRDGLAFLRP